MLISLWVTLTVTLQRTGPSDCDSNAQTPGGRATSACEGEAQTVGTLNRDSPSRQSHFLGFFDVRAKWAREEAVTLGNPPGGREWARLTLRRAPCGFWRANPASRLQHLSSPARDVPSVSWLIGPSCFSLVPSTPGTVRGQQSGRRRPPSPHPCNPGEASRENAQLARISCK